RNGIPDSSSRFAANISRLLGSNLEGNRNGQLSFIQIRDIKNKRTVMASMNETEAGRATQRHDHAVHNSVQTRMGGGQRHVDSIASMKIFGIILSAMPRNTRRFGCLPVH